MKYYPFLEFRDPQTGQVVKEINEVHTMNIEALAASPNDKYVATGTLTTAKESERNEFTNGWDVINNQDPIRLWDMASGIKVKEFGPLRGAVRALRFTSDSKTLISCQTDKTAYETIWLWDVDSGQLIERMRTPKSFHNFFSCEVSPDGHTIAMPVEDKIYVISIQQ